LIINISFYKYLSRYFFKGFIDEEDKLVWEERKPFPLPVDRACACSFKER